MKTQDQNYCLGFFFKELESFHASVQKTNVKSLHLKISVWEYSAPEVGSNVNYTTGPLSPTSSLLENSPVHEVGNGCLNIGL